MPSTHIPREQWSPRKRQLTLLSGGHSGNPAWWPMSARVRSNTGASIVVTVRCHGKGQGLEVGTDLLCQVSAQVGGIAMGLALGIGKWVGTKVGSSFGVLERRSYRGPERTSGYVYLFNTPGETLLSPIRRDSEVGPLRGAWYLARCPSSCPWSAGSGSRLLELGLLLSPLNSHEPLLHLKRSFLQLNLATSRPGSLHFFRDTGP